LGWALQPQTEWEEWEERAELEESAVGVAQLAASAARQVERAGPEAVWFQAVVVADQSLALP
jgi:hypothetical protein